MADEIGIIERGLAEAAKMDIRQLRSVTKELGENAAEREEFKKDPTTYLRSKMVYIPEGFHAHYAEGTTLIPPETMGLEGRERVAFSIPIEGAGVLSTCVFCSEGCCSGTGGDESVSPER
jgi:hypothetical protein